MPENQARIYPEDGISGRPELDIIDPGEVHTLDEMFRERVRRSGDRPAYAQYDDKNQQWVDYSWAALAAEVERWQVAMQEQGLEKGDRVAIRLRNSVSWVVCDQAALRLGLVVVPLYVDDRPDNVNYVLNDSGTKLLLVETLQEWHEIRDADAELPELLRVLVLSGQGDSELVQHVDDWLPEQGQHLERGMAEPDDLASIVYTSGTTGRPKGVMLSHKNMLHNAYAGMRSVQLRPDDVMLSFLPLSHTFERTIGYYSALMSGVHLFYNRSIPELADDLLHCKPTALIAVPRIFERVSNKIYAGLAEGPAWRKALFHYTVELGWKRFEHQQGRQSWQPSMLLYPLLDLLVGKKVRAKLGGRLRFAVVGGAPLSPAVAKTFIGLGVLLLQGYGLTESSPVISVNTLTHNKPDTIGLPLRGVEVAIGEDNELLSRGDNVMLGYWNNPEATAQVIDDENWLHTGDQASIDDQGFIRIIGRLKDILVLANGEKVPPADMEAAILKENLFEQVMVVGESKPFLSVLLVLNADAWSKLKAEKGYTDQDVTNEAFLEMVLQRIRHRIEGFPGYAKIHKAHVMLGEWTVEEGLITPTLKVKRPKVSERFSEQIAAMYEGHGVKANQS